MASSHVLINEGPCSVVFTSVHLLLSFTFIQFVLQKVWTLSFKDVDDTFFAVGVVNTARSLSMRHTRCVPPSDDVCAGVEVTRDPLQVIGTPWERLLHFPIFVKPLRVRLCDQRMVECKQIKEARGIPVNLSSCTPYLHGCASLLYPVHRLSCC